MKFNIPDIRVRTTYEHLTPLLRTAESKNTYIKRWKTFQQL